MADGETTNLTHLGTRIRQAEEEIEADVVRRLQTYDDTWTGKKEKMDLAKAGFSYTGIGDKVECDQCGLKLLNWTSTDDPLHEHATRRPLCPFINSRYRQLGQTKPPKHPKYQQLQDRLDSFTSWPTQYVPKAPEELAAAGFFYIGSADRVTCFQCGITLRDWEEEHDPVTEHQRYSENCQFINKTDLDQLGVTIRQTNADKDALNSPQVKRENDLKTENRTKASALPSPCPIKSMLPNCQATEDDFCASHTELSYLQSTNITATESTSKASISKETANETGTLDARQPSSKMLSSSRLAEENERLKVKGMCRICQEKGVATLFLPCGHLVTCSDCATTVSECLVCEKKILGTVKTFFS